VFKQRSERFEAVTRGDVEDSAQPSGRPLPAAVQCHTEFAAGIVASGRQRDAGPSFVAFIKSPEAQAAWTARGFEAP